MLKNYFEDCVSVEGTVDLVFDDNASFSFMVEKIVRPNGQSVEMVKAQRLVFTAVAVLDNEPIYVGDSVRLTKREGGIVFPENLTREMYTPLSDVLMEYNRYNRLLSVDKVVIIAGVNKVFAGFNNNIWLRLNVMSISTDSMRWDGVSKPVSLRFDYYGLFSSMSETMIINTKIALKKLKEGEQISIELSSFTAVEGDLRCRNIRINRKVGTVWKSLSDVEVPPIDISALWTT